MPAASPSTDFESLAERELEAAAAACDEQSRKVHLDRAAEYALLAEQARLTEE